MSRSLRRPQNEHRDPELPEFAPKVFEITLYPSFLEALIAIHSGEHSETFAVRLRLLQNQALRSIRRQ